jgi:hypothetical protein
MPLRPFRIAATLLLAIPTLALLHATPLDPTTPSPISFELHKIPFRLENDPTPAHNLPESMPGGVAIFDYNSDGHPDIFFTNGANIATLHKDSPKYSDRLFRNNGDGTFTDVTAKAGLAGTGYDMGVAVADYNNDGHPDIFIAGLHHNALYRNNGNGTFTDVTAKAGLANSNDPQYGPLWAVAALWIDVNNDGLLDLFIVDYVQWTYSDQPLCSTNGVAFYCHPRSYKAVPNRLFLNKGDGTFEDVSKAWGIRDHVSKGMAAVMADYDLDNRPDIFVTNDTEFNSLFHNLGNRFEEVAFDVGVALPEDGNFISGMGADFRDFNNDGYPDIAFVALKGQTFPLYQNTGKSEFREVTTPTGMRTASFLLDGFGAGLFDFDNDGWKDLFVCRGHVEEGPAPFPGKQPNTVFRNPGASGKWLPLTDEAGLNAAPPALHRGCTFADLNGDGRVDVVTTALGQDAEIWINHSPNHNHWLDVALRGTKSNRDGIGARIKVVSTSGTQYNHMTTSVGYASSSDVPVHFGLGPDTHADSIEIHWPSGTIQLLKTIPADQILHVTEPPN